MLHPLRGLLLGPLIAPISYWIGLAVYASLSDVPLSSSNPLRELAVIVVFGLPIAYAAALLWGAPIVYVLHRLGWLRPVPLMVAGAIGGMIVAWLLTLDQQGSIIRLRMSVPAGAVIGALVAATTWWAGQGKPDRDCADLRTKL